MASSTGPSTSNASGPANSSSISCGSCATSTLPGSSSSLWGSQSCQARGWSGYPTDPNAVCGVTCHAAESGVAPVTVELRLVANNSMGEHIVHVDQEGTPGIHREWRTSAVATAPNWNFRDLTPDGGMYPDGEGEFHLQVQWPTVADAGPNEDNVQVWSDTARTTQVLNSQTPALTCTLRTN